MRIPPFLLFIAATVVGASAQPVDTVSHDNGRTRGYYYNMPALVEESVILQPEGPCSVLEVHVYFAGTTPRRDTLWIVGDPAEGSIAPTSWVWDYNTLAPPIPFEYDGVPGWKVFDLRGAGVRSDGFDRIVVQHRIQATGATGGPWFMFDANGAGTPLRSFLMDPTKTNSFNFPGQYYASQGDFMVRLLVSYDHPKVAGGSEGPPPATLVDATKDVGIVDGTGALLRGARASVADWNGDGWDDLALGGNFFQNRRDGTFENVSATIGIGATAASVWGDYDNDGHIDCYAVNGGSGDRLYRNDGDGTFTDVTGASGLSNPYPTVTPIWLDYDRDGTLDLFISNGRTESNGQETYFADQLWRGNGDGTFTRVTDQSGIGTAEATPLDCWGAAAGDYNLDQRPDIFVATYRLAPDILHRNNGDGSFTDVAAETGVIGLPTNQAGYYGHGIGADWGDYNNDGLPDLVVGNLGHPDWRGLFSNPSLLFRNVGAPSYAFEEVHHDLGIKFFEMNAGVVWLDLDLDGDLDLWHCQYAYEAASATQPERLSRMYINGGAERGFRMSDGTWDLGSKIHGAWTAVTADFDNDGDIDIVAASPTDAIRYFRNDVARRGDWLEVRLEGDGGARVPRDGYGTTMTLYSGATAIQRSLMGGGGGATASQNSNRLHFGLGTLPIDSAVIAFPNGERRVVPGSEIPRNRLYRYSVVDGGSSGLPAEQPTSSLRFSIAGDRLLVQMAPSTRRREVELVDLLGRRLAYARIPAGETELTIDVAGLPNGHSLLRLIEGDEAIVQRVVLTR